MSIIVKWAPFTATELGSMERRMRRLLEGTSGFAGAPLPAADVYETGDEYVVELEVPGYDEQELAVEVADHTLAIKGRRSAKKEEKAKEFSLQERLEREFERRFVLPAEADAERVEASFAKGVLEVHAPRVRKTGVRKTAPRPVTITHA
jgi:HSP20 family protein